MFGLTHSHLAQNLPDSYWWDLVNKRLQTTESWMKRVDVDPNHLIHLRICPMTAIGGPNKQTSSKHPNQDQTPKPHDNPRMSEYIPPGVLESQPLCFDDP
jgi:hypothetical protein